MPPSNIFIDHVGPCVNTKLVTQPLASIQAKCCGSSTIPLHLTNPSDVPFLAAGVYTCILVCLRPNLSTVWLSSVIFIGRLIAVGLRRPQSFSVYLSCAVVSQSLCCFLFSAKRQKKPGLQLSQKDRKRQRGRKRGEIMHIEQ